MRRPVSRGATAEVVDGIIDELAALREVPTPSAMVARVMNEVSDRPTPDLLAWFHRPMRIELRLSPLGILALVAGVTLVSALLLSTRRVPIPMSIAPRASMAVAPARGWTRPAPAPEVLVRFALRAPGARRVAVAGSFNDWNAGAAILSDGGGTGLFSATVSLPPGEHEYMFVVDGRFVTDPAADEHRPDGFGNTNAVLRI